MPATSKERLIERFKLLCDAHGIEVVADATESSLENLKQIYRGTRLRSGEPRGVGPTLQRRLEAKFAGWDGANVGTGAEVKTLPRATQSRVLSAPALDLARRFDALPAALREPLHSLLVTHINLALETAAPPTVDAVQPPIARPRPR